MGCCAEDGEVLIFPSSEAPGGSAELKRMRVLSRFEDALDRKRMRKPPPELPMPWVVLVSVDEVEDLVGDLEGHPDVAAALPNWRLSLASQQQSLVDPGEVRSFLGGKGMGWGYAGAGVHVAVIDSGMAPEVLRHATKTPWQIDFAADGPRLRTKPTDPYGHGSLVAALIHHLAPAATISPIRCFRGRSATLADVVYSLLFLRLLSWPVHLVNLSFSVDAAAEICWNCGEPGISIDPRGPLERLFAELSRVLDPCPIFVAAAGTSRRVAIPASLPDVIAVAAAASDSPVEVERRYEPGPEFVLAPGGSRAAPILSGDPVSFGSSFATAVTTGILAQDRPRLDQVLAAADRSEALRDILGLYLDDTFAGYDPALHGLGMLRGGG